MSNGNDPELVFLDEAHDSGKPGTHVLVIGVGKYTYGKGAGASPVAGDLRQLTLPPISARAIADWFIGSFKNTEKPLVSVSLLISEEQSQAYKPGRPNGATPINLLEATLATAAVVSA